MTNEDRQTVIDALENSLLMLRVVTGQDIEDNAITRALAIMRREQPRACLEVDGFEPIYKD